MTVDDVLEDLVGTFQDPASIIARVLGNEEVGDVELFRRSFTRTFETGDQARLRLSNRNGYVSVRSHDQPRVTISVVADLYADSSREADDEAARIERAMTHHDGVVEVITPELRRPEFMFFGRGPKVDYEVLVPYASALELSSRNGRVEAARVRGPASIESRNGAVTVEDVNERVAVQSRNGKVVVLRAGGEVTAQATNGSVVVERAGGPVRARTTNGPLEFQDVGGEVKAESSNGGIRFRSRVSGDIDLATTNGSIRLAVPEDSRFEVDAESRHGSVRSDLRVRGALPGGGPVPKVRLRAQNGSIRLEAL